MSPDAHVTATPRQQKPTHAPPPRPNVVPSSTGSPWRGSPWQASGLQYVTGLWGSEVPGPVPHIKLQLYAAQVCLCDRWRGEVVGSLVAGKGREGEEGGPPISQQEFKATDRVAEGIRPELKTTMPGTRASQSTPEWQRQRRGALHCWRINTLINITKPKLHRTKSEVKCFR